MLKYGVSNFRRLRETPLIDLKPLTLLVGRNSSGKSSFLRSLPLIAQSISTLTSGAVLWWGDLVDFGSFSETKFRSPGSTSIGFTFGIDSIVARDRTRFGRPIYYYIPESSSQQRNLVGVTLSVFVSGVKRDDTGENTHTYVSSFSMRDEHADFSVECKVTPDGAITSLIANGKDCNDFLQDAAPRLALNTLFPRLLLKPQDIQRPDQSPTSRTSYIVRQLSAILKPYCHGRTKSETIDGYAVRLLAMGAYSRQRLDRMFGSSVSDGRFYRVIRHYLKKAPPEVHSEVQRLFSLALLPDALDAASDHLTATFRGIYYIGPARARSERYYRQQDLSVSRISSDGTNFPMFLASLDLKTLSSFSDIIYELYGYRVKIRHSSGHISILLDEGDDVETNLVDTGYGVSQILPVLGQMWWSSISDERNSSYLSRPGTRILAVEQPELHLHPAHQSKLADAFVAFTRRRPRHRAGHELAFVIETHSESLINKFGEMVYTGALSKDDIQILVFEPEEYDPSSTRVRLSSFNESGSLINWPIGFFGGE